jgi:hypothetical protein
VFQDGEGYQNKSAYCLFYISQNLYAHFLSIAEEHLIKQIPEEIQSKIQLDNQMAQAMEEESDENPQHSRWNQHQGVKVTMEM